jgi:two-component system sensor histidine kinase RegB
MNAAIAPLAPPAPATGQSQPTGLNVRRLIWIRMIAVPGSALCLLLARQIYSLPIPALQMLLIVGGLVAFNFWVWARHKEAEPVTDREFFIQLLVDLFALTSILYYAGGASNPFVYFLVLPMIISAAALPQVYTWIIAGLSACSYTLLMLWRVEVPEFINMHSKSAMDLHAAGMWLGFIVLAVLISTFVAAMAETVRERDRYLARLRETALRDERVVAVATLAAGAAHELSTPLATMAVITGEIAREYPAATHPALNRDLGILRDQIARCKEALSVISASAGAARAESAERLALDRFVRQTAEEVRRLRPGSNVRVESPASAGSPPLLVVERTIRQALLNILHNAVDVSPRDVLVVYGWDAAHLDITVIDHGGGLRSGQPGSLERLGRSSKEGGLGLGLFLSHAAIAQAGGSLQAANNDEGGTTVRLRLPLVRLTEHAA